MTTKKATSVSDNNAGDGFFTPVANTKPYLKAQLHGFAGSGKTYTAAQIAIGLHKDIGSKKPIVMFDTEKAAKHLQKIFADEGIQLLVRDSKSLADLVETFKRMESGASDILIVDSISHIWEEYLQAYAKRVNRTRLQFQDWGVIKPTWKKEFSDKFVSSPLHIIMCGRAGYDYDNEINEDTGKREIYRSGIKVKSEGETAYEPDLMMYMERFEELIGKDKKVWRQATVIKDRTTILDGKTFVNPTYAHFQPTIKVMLENPYERNGEYIPEKDTSLIFKTEEDKFEFRKQRDGLLERLENLLRKVYPASTGKDAQAKIEILDWTFGTSSMTEIAQLHPDELTKKMMALCDHLVETGVAEYQKNSDNQKILVKKEEKKAEK